MLCYDCLVVHTVYNLKVFFFISIAKLFRREISISLSPVDLRKNKANESKET